MHKVAIVILNWNGKKFLETFLPSVLLHSSLPGVRVVVADNGSEDDSVAWLRQSTPEVDVICLDRNYGFAEGYNKALSTIDAEYFLLLNSDVEVKEGWLKPLIDVLDGDPLIAACMPKIKAYPDGQFFEYAGAAGGFIDKYGYTFCRGRIFNAVETDYGQYDNPTDIFWATGACMLVRARLFKIMGGFEASFFAHFEEVDLCWRLKNRGYRIRFTPFSTVSHVGGGTLPATNPWKTYLNYRNNLVMLARNLPDEKLFKYIALRLVLDGIAAVRLLTSCKIRDFIAVIKAHLYLYRNLTSVRNFRDTEKPFITNRDHDEMYPESIVTSYFLKKRYSFASLKWKTPGMR
jgi:GT2 family glycosyltransferase